jgi:hypothetical protein
MQRRDIEIEVMARQVPGVGRQSAAYLGIAALLAAFMVAFATTSKTRAEVGSPVTLAAPFAGKVVPQITELPGRS